MQNIRDLSQFRVKILKVPRLIEKHFFIEALHTTIMLERVSNIVVLYKTDIPFSIRPIKGDNQQ